MNKPTVIIPLIRYTKQQYHNISDLLEECLECKIFSCVCLFYSIFTEQLSLTTSVGVHVLEEL